MDHENRSTEATHSSFSGTPSPYSPHSSGISKPAVQPLQKKQSENNSNPFQLSDEHAPAMKAFLMPAGNNKKQDKTTDIKSFQLKMHNTGGPDNLKPANGPVQWKKSLHSATVAQLKPAQWNFGIGIKPLGADKAVPAKVTLDYDDETGISVRDVKRQLENYKGKFYKVTLHYIGSNTATDGNLKDDNYHIPGALIRLNQAKFTAVLEEAGSQIEQEELSAKKEKRPSNIITQNKLNEIIRSYGFKKVVTGNHIEGARDTKANEINHSVIDQQVREMAGNTLFIDPLFQLPGNEGQYHDHIMKDGGDIVMMDNDLGFFAVQDKEGRFILGILSKSVYTDEIEELGVTCKFYAAQKRPANVEKQ